MKLSKYADATLDKMPEAIISSVRRHKEHKSEIDAYTHKIQQMFFDAGVTADMEIAVLGLMLGGLIGEVYHL